MPYSAISKDGSIRIDNVPDAIAPDSIVLQRRFEEERAKLGVAPPDSSTLSAPISAQQSVDSFTDVNQGIGAGEALLIGVGRGHTTIGRGIGIADPEDPLVTENIERLREQRPFSLGAGEIVGKASPFVAPGTALGAISGLGLRTAASFLLGGLEGGIISRGEGESLDKQFLDAGIGGSIAATLEAFLPSVARIGTDIIRRVFKRSPRQNIIDENGIVSAEFKDALNALGGNEANKEIQNSLRQIAKESGGQVIDPEQGARRAFLEAEGLDPTLPQITRSASDFQLQQELAKTSTPVRRRLDRQLATLTTRFDNAILEAGENIQEEIPIVDEVLTKSNILDQKISDLYEIAENRSDGQKIIRFDNLVDKMKSLAAVDKTASNVVSAVRGVLQKDGLVNSRKKSGLKPTGRADVLLAEEIRKKMNQLSKVNNPFAKSVIREMKDSLDEDVFKAIGEDIFQEARLAKTNFEKGLDRVKLSKFDKGRDNIVRDVLENKIKPSKFVQKVILSPDYNAKDLKQLLDYVGDSDSGIDSINSLKSSVLETIKDKTTSNVEDELGNSSFSATAFDKILNKIGNKKLNVLFTPEEFDFLKTFGKILKIRQPVSSTALGRGPSAQAIDKLAIRADDSGVVLGLMKTFLRNIRVNKANKIVLNKRLTPQREALRPLRGVSQLSPAVVPPLLPNDNENRPIPLNQ